MAAFFPIPALAVPPAGAIRLSAREVQVAGEGAMTYDRVACLHRRVRERLPQSQIRFAGMKKAQAPEAEEK